MSKPALRHLARIFSGQIIKPPSDKDNHYVIVFTAPSVSDEAKANWLGEVGSVIQNFSAHIKTKHPIKPKRITTPNSVDEMHFSIAASDVENTVALTQMNQLESAHYAVKLNAHKKYAASQGFKELQRIFGKERLSKTTGEHGEDQYVITLTRKFPENAFAQNETASDLMMYTAAAIANFEHYFNSPSNQIVSHYKYNADFDAAMGKAEICLRVDAVEIEKDSAITHLKTYNKKTFEDILKTVETVDEADYTSATFEDPPQKSPLKVLNELSDTKWTLKTVPGKGSFLQTKNPVENPQGVVLHLMEAADFKMDMPPRGHGIVSIELRHLKDKAELLEGLDIAEFLKPASMTQQKKQGRST